jgi:hypothetical protein
LNQTQLKAIKAPTHISLLWSMYPPIETQEVEGPRGWRLREQVAGLCERLSKIQTERHNTLLGVLGGIITALSQVSAINTLNSDSDWLFPALSNFNYAPPTC